LYVPGGSDVALIDGGTNASLTAVNGGVVYSNATAMAITSVGTSGQALVSTGASAPAWTTLTLENLPGAWVKKAVRVATTAALGGTYANGTAGVGATLTITSTTIIDGVTLANGDRILVKDQATTFQNGIYDRTSATVLTRSSDADASGDISAGVVAIDEGTVNGGSSFTNYFKATDTIGTTAMVWSKVVDSSQLGANVATFLATPTSTNLRTAVATTSTGTGSLVFATSPTLTTPIISATTSVTDGSLAWVAASDQLSVGNGTAQSVFTSDTGSTTLTNKTLTDPKINIAFAAKTANYTPTAADITDNGKMITFNSATAVAFNIPTNANNAYAIGTQINVLQIGAGQVTIQAVTPATTTVSSTSATPTVPKLRAQFSSATCIKAANDLWYVIGDII
jgi:hypothetical protein